ncbi:hypothetical protein [Streptomyces sp. NPDC058745]|uniref:hypothetical protein n=1 Tax=Streptomyces sp. NPDC058745 TaxID=3346621 RepID=UPI00369C2481
MTTTWTIIVATLTAVVTTVATGLLVMPRLDARKRRILELHLARDTFRANMLKIIGSCMRLGISPAPAEGDPEVTAVGRERLIAERSRWLGHLDESTTWMLDHVETFAMSWPNEQLQRIAFAYVTTARGVVLSERTDEAKTGYLKDLTDAVWQVFGARMWQHKFGGWDECERRIAELAREHALDSGRQDDPAPVA